MAIRGRGGLFWGRSGGAQRRALVDVMVAHDCLVVRGRREMKLLVEVAPCLPVRLRCGAGGLSQACQLAEACNYSGFETTFGDTYRPKPVPHYWNSPVSSHTPSTSVPRLFSAVSVVRSSFQLRDTNVARHLLCWPSGHGTHARFP